MSYAPQVNTDSTYIRTQSSKRVKAHKFWADVKWFLRTKHTGTISLLFLLLIVALAIFAPFITPYDPVTQDRQAFMEAPSATHIMGTDDLGRDIFSRILYGARTSLIVGFGVVLISAVIGSALGLISGYFGGKIDMVIQRIMDSIMAIPLLVLALFIAALLGPAIENVIIALSVIKIPQFARVTRGEMLRIREENFVEASRAAGAHPFRIVFRHGLPNMTASIIVLGSLAFGQAIIAEAALSFLGVGTPPPNPSWGLMLSGSSSYMEVAPWMVIFPGLALSFTVLALNMLGDALRDYLDPKLS